MMNTQNNNKHLPHRCFSILERVVDRGQTSSCPNLEGGKHSRVNQTKNEFGGSGSGGSELVMQEMAATAGSLHSFLVLPWYTRVSPDTHHSYQVSEMFFVFFLNVPESLKLNFMGIEFSLSKIQIRLSFPAKEQDNFIYRKL